MSFDFQPFTVSAPAKINLFLHITGRRPDGYHRLESLVEFADPHSDSCDRLHFAPAEKFSLTIAGKFSAVLKDTDPQHNLVTRAAKILCGDLLPVAVTLEKNLPVAAGIGGGSADAAACLRALSQITGKNAAEHGLLTLGADLPACLESRACLVRGIGEDIRPVTLPRYALLLVHPDVPVPTPEVFKTYAAEQQIFSNKSIDFQSLNFEELLHLLGKSRNDLQNAAMRICPEISDVLNALQKEAGCLLSRMSGSGATCFGIFDGRENAGIALANLQKTYPAWWTVAAKGF